MLLSFLRRFAVSCAVIAVLTTAGVVAANAFFNSGFGAIKSIHLGDSVLAPQKPGKPENFLLVGSDTRAFATDPADIQAFGSAQQVGGARSDTMMVVHLDPSNDTALLVSFPRDVIVDVPGHGQTLLNAAFSIGGPQLLIRTIQKSFGVGINHYLEVDFQGFKQIVDTIGHVKIWFPTPVHDPYTGLVADTRGCRALNGDQALAYARSRHYYIPSGARGSAPWTWNPRRETTGPGWIDDPRQDLDRIERQQYFVRSLGQAAINAGARNLIKGYQLLNEVTKHLSKDAPLGVNDLKALVRTFRDLNPATVEMTTLPVSASRDGAHLLVKYPDAQPLLNRLNDFGLPPSALPPVVTPGEVRLRVANGSGVKHRAKQVLDAFVAKGYVAAGPAVDADRDYPRTQVRYAPGKGAEGLSVATALGTADVVQANDTLGADVLVVVGRDYDELRGPLEQLPAATTTTAPTSTAPTTTPPSTSTTTTTPPAKTGDTRFVPVDPKTGGRLVGCP